MTQERTGNFEWSVQFFFLWSKHYYNLKMIWNMSYIYIFFFFTYLFFPFIFISWRLITLQYCSGFCHTLT